MEVVLLTQILKRLVNSMIILRMCSHQTLNIARSLAPFMEDIVVSEEGVTKLLKKIALNQS